MTVTRTLGLASPLRAIAEVKDAQTSLKTNVFKTDFHPGTIDGVYGEATARATKRAKYWLGYALKDMTDKYGVLLDSYLDGRKELNPAKKARRAARLKAAQNTPLREKALNQIKTQLGVTENPKGTNKNKFGNWYGMDRVPWCAECVTWCYVTVGSKAFLRGRRYAYVPYIVHDARAGVNWLSVTDHPKPGDLVCFDWDNDGVADHVGMVLSMGTGGAFKTIEGNTGIGNDSNGGEVMQRDRNKRDVQAFVHVGR